MDINSATSMSTSVNEDLVPIDPSSISDINNTQNISTTATSTNNKPKGSEELCEFLENLDRYSSTVPEAVVKYHLQKGGCSIHDPRILKLVGLAADKFLADIVHEAKEISKLRNSTGKRKTNEYVLEMVCSFTI